MQKRIINFMGLRNIAIAFTFIFSLVALGSLAVKGLNFGLDFTGGTLIELQYDQAADLDAVRNQLKAAGYGDAVVQNFGATTDVVVRIQSDAADLGNKVASALREADSSNNVTVQKVEFVGPQVGEELRDQGGIGMLLAMFGVMLYVVFRFQWKFAIGSLITLLHDVIIVIGIFAFFGWTFDLTVLAAILAIIGYSLNDTIVVYDRVRENMRLLRKADLIENINISTTQTLLRTTATSLSTLLAVLALLFFGGENLWGFAMALTIGVVVGTYSSVYISSVFLIWTNLTREDLIPPQVEEVDETP
ncbi:protein translocase subunit SecF [Atopomonas sediminilitoris]|uniref:protein translocase subunit SecF n=1 Tax=Atopomonas sediminilitoris TaxID=2919919 RepID=UPI001F4E6F16|nr:protein translocase subunit SecF [Atopomonas sediminilitoris]MCJ8168717.1 protein translocase subunit SecF [Atopomonas sediminilitoris]